MGNKTANLTELKQRYPQFVPNFVEIDLLDLITNRDKLTLQDLSRKQDFQQIRNFIRNVKLSETEIEKTISLVKKTVPLAKVAVRSSAGLEDSSSYSFAGIFDSKLDVELTSKEFEKALREVWASYYSKRVETYKRSNKIDEVVLNSKVIIQEMFEGEYYGVAFVYGKVKIILLSFNNKKEDTVRGDRSFEIIYKNKLDIYNFPNNIDSDRWEELLNTLFDITKHKNEPQDIEWAISGSRTAILQSRDITTRIDQHSKVVWDKTNIGENYPFKTMPLTYSFIQEAYCEVYKNFLRLLGVSEKNIEENSNIFNNMIGYLEGEVFYNLNNWYNLLKLLPGYGLNKKLFDNMLKPVQKNEDKSKSKISLSFILKNIRVIIKLISGILFIRPHYKYFAKEYKKIMDSYSEKELCILDNFSLVSYFKKLQKEFFPLWSRTIMNDFRVMVFLGLHDKFAHKFLVNSNEIISNINSTKSIAYSIKPLQKLYGLRDEIKNNDKLLSDFVNTNIDLSKISEYESFNKMFWDYIEEFGERFQNELKLEEENLKDNPDKLIYILKTYLKSSSTKIISKKSIDPIFKTNLNKIIFNPVYKLIRNQTVSSIHKREEFRLNRAKVFYIAKQMFVEMGNRLYSEDIISNPKDIFYLYTEEVFNLFEFHRLSFDVKEIINIRKSNFESLKLTKLNKREETIGFYIKKIHAESNVKQDSILGDSTSLNNMIEGEAVVMDNLRLDIDVNDKILVTTRTDPGWTILFPLLKGIITEHGNTLSHASVVARELGIVCIVNVDNATQIIHTGDKITLNGKTGEIQIRK